MQRHWNDHELVTHWSLSTDELALLLQRDASSRLGMAASLKFFQLAGRFRTSTKEIPPVVLHYLALYQHSCHQPQSSKDDHAMVWG
jgi:Domain of unknown function (DUF4158)